MKENQGQTLVEILIAITIGSVLLVGTLSILTSFFSSRKRGRQLNQLTTTGSNILSDINQEIHWSQDADLSVANELTLEQEDGAVTVTYFFDQGSGKLLKDGAPISPEEVTITAFDVKNRAPSDSPPLLQIHLGLEHVDQHPKISLEKDTTISLRKWQLGLP